MLGTLTLAGVLLAAAPPQADQTLAPTTRLIPISGVLVDGSGAPLAGAHTVTFSLFDTEADGTLLWTETQTVTADARGAYATRLGVAAALPLEIFRTEQARWLEVTVNGHALPRIMLVAVPYALKAMDAETLGGQPADRFLVAGPDGRPQTASGTDLSGLAVDGTGVTYQLAKWIGSTTLSSSIITESPSNQIGIGTTDPTEGGAIDSKLTIRTNDGSTALAVSNQAGTPRFALNVNGDGSWITYDRATGSFLPGIAQRGGRVGVATTDPTGGGVVDAKFTVRNLDNNTGIAVLNQANARRFALNTAADGSWLMYDGGTSTWNQGIIQVNGRVGLGMTPPAPSAFTSGRLVVSPSGETSTIFARKTSSSPFSRAVNGRFASTVTAGAAVSGVAGLDESSDVGPGTPVGVFASAHVANSYGLYAYNPTATGAAVYATGGQYAGQFAGNVQVTGTLSKGGGAFKIDHPLDPANKYLQHSFVESPDMMNVYNGNIVLDGNGEAIVTLPEWFEALNRDFRYQLTSIGAPGPNLYIAEKVSGNHFKIAGGAAGAEVSWQVTGIRQDAWANAHRIVVETDKPEGERGLYLHPEALGLSSEMSIGTSGAGRGVVMRHVEQR